MATDNKKYTSIIVEDELPALRLIQDALERIPYLNIVATARNIDEAEKEILYHRPDIVFLDIELYQRSAFELLQALSSRDLEFGVIFLTAHGNNYLRKAVQTVGLKYKWAYFCKPVDLEEIQATLRDFRKDFDPGNEKEKLIIRRKAAITSLYLDEILYVRVNGNHASIHSIYEQSIPTNETIGEIAEKLPASDFYRADASTLIRRKAVLQGMIDPTDNRFIIQLRGIKRIVEVVVARSKFTDFKREIWE